MTQKPPTLGILQTYPFTVLQQFLRGTLRYVQESHFYSIESPYMLNAVESLKKLKTPPSGILAPIFSRKDLKDLLSYKVPVIGICNAIDQPEIPTVCFNDVAIGNMAADYLLRHHYQHFAYIGYGNLLFSKERKQGFANTLRNHGHLLKDVYELNTSEISTRIHSLPQLKVWLEGLKKPCAVFGCSDICAIYAHRSLEQTSLKVPEDIALLGADNDSLLQNLYNTSISSVDPDFERIGWEGCRVMEDLLTGRIDCAPFKFRQLPKGVVNRGSAEIQDQGDAYINHALELIRSNIYNDFNVNDLVDLLPLSRRALERKFLKQVGRTPKQEILYQRMSKACQMLEHSNSSLSEIATLLGFEEQRKLTRQFKQFMGMTPMHYRKVHNESENPFDSLNK
ncbi:MAG: substrate-binding domain-containing protein [Opitutales bacterium]|nr:substrate-binding domain-containing protein [Opitutales bacterium]